MANIRRFNYEVLQTDLSIDFGAYDPFSKFEVVSCFYIRCNRIYNGTWSCSAAKVCQQYEFYNDKNMSRSVKFATLLITYKVLLKDKVVLSKIKSNYLMVNEALRLKNREACLYTTLLEFSTKNRLLITGTPLKNGVEELW
ncbi:CHROMATIN REMODELING 5 [Olea europaea subsp. europaea]|uniref:CHROMATIN REMODELING 5 n=1 Tax=Olea europaea subsp. europaea TaxID=158383 RepID=A0A8S0SUT6_OLEEU|nr:CHROMATIN REMODELING 5 [Olea europaea subsp. europaea]